MNNDRRKAIEAVRERLESVKDEILGLQGDEQDAFDGMPEGLQQGERGQAAEAAVEALGEAYDAVEGALDHLGEAVSS